MVFLWESRNCVIVLPTMFPGMNLPRVYFLHIHLCHLREVMEAEVGTEVRSADIRLSIISSAIGFSTMRVTAIRISTIRSQEVRVSLLDNACLGSST